MTEKTSKTEMAIELTDYSLGKTDEEYLLAEQKECTFIWTNKKGEPDLYDGFNLHHIVSVSKPISRHFSLSTSFVHISGAGLGNGTVSNQDVITLGIKWNL